METTTNKPTVSVSQFKADVSAGMSKSQLIDKWKISGASVKQLATKFGLTIQRAVTPKFILVDDETETSVQSEVTFKSLETAPLNN